MTRSAAAILIALTGFAALAARLPRLRQRPMHGDEAIHAVRFGQLLSEGRFVYDPNEYHGPTLYYLTLPGVRGGPAARYEQTNEIDYRIVPVFFGALLVLLLVPAASGLGRAAAAWAAGITAISPIMVFYSRYYIHEMPLAAFTFMTILCGWRWARTRRLGWALAAGVCAGLMHATKETAALAWAAMGAGLGATWVWDRWVIRTAGPGPDASAPRRAHGTRPVGITPDRMVGVASADSPPRKGRVLVHVFIALVAGAIISIVLFSGFFTNLDGPRDSLATYATYLHRAEEEGRHIHPWWAYARWLLWTRHGRGPVFTELPIAVLAIVGIGASLAGSPDGETDGSLLRFLAFYTIALTAIYAAIPYKTPWCALSFWHGAILMAGVGLAFLVRGAPRLLGSLTDSPRRKAGVQVIVGVLIGGGAIGVLAWQAWRGNVRFYADGRNPYVYAHPIRDAMRLVDRVYDLAAVAADGPDLDIRVLHEECDWWPLPWYFRHFDQERIGYFRDLPPPAGAEVLAGDVIIASPPMHEGLGRLIDLDGYVVEHYGLRPHVVLLLCVRKDLWDRFIASRRARPAKGGSP